MILLSVLSLLLILHASAAPTTSTQDNECRWGRFAGDTSEPDWSDGPFTVSVLIDRPPKVVYPRIAEFISELSTVLDRNVFVYQCKGVDEIYANLKENRYLIDQEKANLYFQTYYKTGVVVLTSLKNCTTDDIECVQEETSSIMRDAEKAFLAVLRRPLTTTTTQQPPISSPLSGIFFLFAVAFIACISCCMCCCDMCEKKRHPLHFEFEEVRRVVPVDSHHRMTTKNSVRSSLDRHESIEMIEAPASGRHAA